MRMATPARAATADATALVLAGGRSSRMGTAKALLPFDGVPLIVHLTAALLPRFAEVIVVAAPGQELPPLDARVVRDEVPYQGPVGGICRGLEAAVRDLCFVTPADAPFPDFALIAHLVALAPGYDAIVPRWRGRLQPLHAVYRRAVLPGFRDRLARGELRLADAIDALHTLHVADDEIRRFDSGGLTFVNINTPAEYRDALRRWRTIRTA
jgi:molybdopterin-guanine dinucleotide biosynthesis protein A